MYVCIVSTFTCNFITDFTKTLYLPDSIIYDEKELLSQVAQGEETAFESLFALYRDRFYAVALKLTQLPYAAEEVVQEVFITVWNKRGRLANVDKPSSYLFTIFYRTLYAHLKQEALELSLKRAFASISPESENVLLEEGLTSEQRYELLEQAIDSLPPQQAMVYRLTKQEGLSRQAVAAQMGLSPNTVRNHLGEATRTIHEFVRAAGLLLLLLNCSSR